jgi:hypothetical protein
MADKLRPAHSAIDNGKDEAQIGYGHPPRQHQFKKGQPSPYPKGRPRGSRAPNLTKVLLEPVDVRIKGRTRKLSFPEAYVQVIKEKALKGDLKAGQMLILLWKQLGFLRPVEAVEDVEFTLKIGDSSPPDWIKARSKNNQEEPEK